MVCNRMWDLIKAPWQKCDPELEATFIDASA